MATYVPITTEFLNTPRRKAESAAGSSVSEMIPLPSAPAVKNSLVPMPLVVNANVALVVEIEKVNVKLDLISKNLVEFEAVIMEGVGAVVPSVSVVPYVPPVPPVDLAVTLTLMMCQYDEMRRAMACDQEKMRAFIRNRVIAMVVLIFVMTIVVVSHVHVLVYTLKEPAVCEPCLEYAVVSDWMIAKCFANDWYKNARDEWVRITK